MKRFSNILLVADAAQENSVAFKRTIELCKSNQGTLTIIDVVQSIPADLLMDIVAVTPDELLDIAVSEKRAELDKMVAAAKDSGVQVESEVLVGKTFLEIIRQVLRNGHDLVVKSSEPKAKLKRTLFGSTDMHLLRKCPCPVWITKSDELPRYHRIIAAVDNDPQDGVTEALNQQILEMSSSLALAESSELHIVHAWKLAFESHLRSPRMIFSDAEVDSMVAEERRSREQWLENLVTEFAAKGNKEAVDYLGPQLHLIEGDANHIVSEKAQELKADLVVMGTVARIGIAGLVMGNTAESILMELNCSVLTVKPPGFVSPVTVKQ